MRTVDTFKAWLRSAPRIRNPFAAPVVHIVYKAVGLHGTYCYKCKLGSVNNRHKLMIELQSHYASIGRADKVLATTKPVIEIVEIF
jgi:hypothetical protein